MAVKPIVSRAVLDLSGRSKQTRSPGERLFDDVAVQHRLVARFLADEGTGIRLVRPARSAGVYGLRYRGSHPAYRALDAEEFIYCGKGAALGERVSSHLKSLSEAEDLDVEDFALVVIPLASLVHAEAAERLLIGAFNPLWCRQDWLGFGSRPQGSGRRGQRPTDWDRRHPGRLTRTQGQRATGLRGSRK